MWLGDRMRSAVALLLSVSCVGMTGCTDLEGSDGQAPAPPVQTESSPGPAPEACLDAAEATRETVKGTPTWAMFCPGPEGRTAPAEVPSDVLTTHLDVLAGLSKSVKATPLRSQQRHGAGGHGVAPTESRSATPMAVSLTSRGTPTPTVWDARCSGHPRRRPRLSRCVRVAHDGVRTPVRRRLRRLRERPTARLP